MSVAWVREDTMHYNENMIDQDGLWKKVIEELFGDFILFFAPELHAHIDLDEKPVFLDKELFQEVADKKKGRRFADRLAKSV